MRTLGDLYPRLRGLPGYEEIASIPALDYPPTVVLPTHGWSGIPPEPIPGRSSAERVALPRSSNRVRVGLLSPCLFQGGAEAWMLSLARSTDPARIAWRGCAVMPGGVVDPEMRASLSSLMPVEQGRDHALALAADCDLLVTWAVDDLPGLLEGLVRAPRVVGVVHAPIESEWGRTVYARPQRIDRWVAVSELALAAIPAASRQAAPASVIWNCVDSARMEVCRSRSEMRAAWGVPGNAPVAGYLGRLTEEKDPRAMLRLAAHLPPPWHVVIVGDGWMRTALESEAAGIDRLHLVGLDPRAGDVLEAFDALVVPSHYESFGLALAEGLWAGVPVVSTGVGIARLVPGLTREVPVGTDGPALAAAVLADFADPAGTSARVARGQSFARERVGSERFGREWTDLLISLAPPEIRSRVAKRAEPNPHEARRMLALACDYRGAPVGCGCRKSVVCLAGKGWPIAESDAREVFASDCLACVISP